MSYKSRQSTKSKATETLSGSIRACFQEDQKSKSGHCLSPATRSVVRLSGHLGYIRVDVAAYMTATLPLCLSSKVALCPATTMSVTLSVSLLSGRGVSVEAEPEDAILLLRQRAQSALGVA